MSKHNSLKISGGATGKRSVLKRFERVKLLKERGQWKEGQSPLGLAKVRVQKISMKKKKAKAKEDSDKTEEK